MSEFDFQSRTRSVPARLLRVGQVDMESAAPVHHRRNHGHIRTADHPPNSVRLATRHEPTWGLGTYHPDALLEKAI